MRDGTRELNDRLAGALPLPPDVEVRRERGGRGGEGHLRHA